MPPLRPTDSDLNTLLTTIGIESPDEVFASIPAALRLEGEADLPGPLDEERLRMSFQAMPSRICFAGGGVYRHHIPAVVDALSSRQEFYTAYTPYQPEVSQGTLQTIFEFQSMLADLCGMELANASMYDGATALAEAARMALRNRRIRRILVTRATHPSYRAVLSTYLRHARGIEIQEIPFDPATGQLDLERLAPLAGEDTAFFVQHPNYFGVLEPMEDLAPLAAQCGFWGMVVCEAVSLGLLKPPGAYGPQVVLGEAQSFGNPPGAGGPLLGFFCTRKEFVRHMPGRLVGQTCDRQGRRAFCLTLATREQHIRRDKATSNICTNQGLCALRAAIHLSALGPRGLRQVAVQCASGASYLKGLLCEKGIAPVFDAPVFHEFVVRLSDPLASPCPPTTPKSLTGSSSP